MIKRWLFRLATGYDEKTYRYVIRRGAEWEMGHTIERCSHCGAHFTFDRGMDWPAPCFCRMTRSTDQITDARVTIDMIERRVVPHKD